MPTYTLSTQLYLDQYNKSYKKIITINCNPCGPLSQHVKRINPPKLSPFKSTINYTSTCCIFVITDINCNQSFNHNHTNDFMDVENIPSLFTFLSANGYTIDTKLTKMLQTSDIRLSNDLLCFISC